MGVPLISVSPVANQTTQITIPTAGYVFTYDLYPIFDTQAPYVFVNGERALSIDGSQSFNFLGEVYVETLAADGYNYKLYKFIVTMDVPHEE